MRIDYIILAAGLSSRMGGNKLLLPYQNKPILQHVIDLVNSSSPFSACLVSRPETLNGVNVPKHFRVIVNDVPEQGQSISMRLGLKDAAGDGFLFFQGDQPLLDKATLNAVLEQCGPNKIVVPEHGGIPGNPVFFPAGFKDALMAVQGDRGGRSVRDSHPECCIKVQIESSAPLFDVDTKEKYHALLQGNVN